VAYWPVSFLLAAGDSWAVYCCHAFLGIHRGCRRCGKLQSFFADAIAPNTFLREVPLTRAVSSSAVQRQMQIYLMRIPRRKGHSIQRVVQPGLDHFWRKPPHPRSPSSWPKREGSQVATGNSDRTTGPNLGSSCLLHVLRRFRWTLSFATMQSTWAEDRALLWKQPERRPRGQDRMGRHDAALFHSGLAPKR
jgi:hypothetical protein